MELPVTLEYFHKRKAVKDGLSSSCKKCRKIYFDANKERKRVYDKEYNKKNKEKIKECNKKRYARNKNKRQVKSKIYYEKNKEKIKTYSYNYRKENKNIIIERDKIHRNKLALYNSYANNKSLNIAEKTKRDSKNLNLLQVKCAYCGKWFSPTNSQVSCRIGAMEGRVSGENRFYCNDNCKQACPIYAQKLYPKGFKKSTSREVQPELRQMVLARDNYTCQKCSLTIDQAELHCHHITGVVQNPLESADVDNCVTLCKACHKQVHKLPGCGYHELRCVNGD